MIPPISPKTSPHERAVRRADTIPQRPGDACTVAEVEVDDEAGDVRVPKLTNRLRDRPRPNPALAHQRIVGGAWMGISHALYVTTEPCYPDRKCGPTDFAHYLMPGPGDLAEMESIIIERPAASGPCGAKGIGEMTANSPIPAIANAIFDATLHDSRGDGPVRGLDALRGRTQQEGTGK